ncbi:hypothetical protein Tco_0848727 [Tanacetum coccineum]
MFSESSSSSPSKSEEINSAQTEAFSTSEERSSLCLCHAKDTSASALQVLKQHLHFSLGCGTKTDKGLTKSFTFTTKYESRSVNKLKTRIFTSVLVDEQKLKRALARASLIQRIELYAIYFVVIQSKKKLCCLLTSDKT